MEVHPPVSEASSQVNEQILELHNSGLLHRKSSGVDVRAGGSFPRQLDAASK